MVGSRPFLLTIPRRQFTSRGNPGIRKLSNDLTLSAVLVQVPPKKFELTIGEQPMNDGSSSAAVHVLTSWKDIARYMGKGVRTVQRWEQDFGLPVRRPQGSSKKAILARPRDLDAWVALRCTSRTEQFAGDGQPPPNRSCSRASLGVLSTLNAQIETSRLLRSSNQLLMSEIRFALNRLRTELQAFPFQRKV